MAVLLKSFWDDGLSKTGQLFTIAGYAGDLAQWSQFDHDWNAALGLFDVSHFHATDFVSRKRPFDGAEWNCQNRRSAFVAALCRAIEDAELRGLTATVDTAALDRANTRHGFSYTPYAYAAANCMVEFKNVYQGDAAGEVFLDRIDDGKQELDSAESIIRRLRVYGNWWNGEPVSWRHLTKAEKRLRIRGIEAADFAVWGGPHFDKEIDHLFGMVTAGPEWRSLVSPPLRRFGLC